MSLSSPSRAPPQTSLWLRVVNAEEAAIAAAAGVDGVETVPAAIEAVRSCYAGPLKLRVDTSQPCAALDRIDMVCVPANALSVANPVAGALRGDGAPVIVARLRLGEATPERISKLADRADVVTIEVASEERLFAVAGIAELDACARASRAAGLAFGISGNLEAPDVARLLLLEPAHLGFDRAARFAHDADAALDPAAVALLRGLVPHRGATRPSASGGFDRLFVRDLVVPLSVGVYRAEHNSKQRLRFSVEADVARSTRVPRDMRDIVSYDVIVETIRMLVGRSHTLFVETLAEDIATTLLRQPGLLGVVVTVEKLDILDGRAGVCIERRRA